MDDVTATARWSAEAIAARIVRYRDLQPCFNAFIDTRTPGSEAKENFTIIGPGVSENPDQHVHITQPHGFNIGGARQPPGCVNSQHSHDTAEVFVVHTGRWSFNLGEHGDAARVECGPGDTISLPTGMFRGFTNIGDDIGFLWAVLGSDVPGRVLWAPEVFDMAADYGLVLLENGTLIDTAAGQAVPADVAPMPRTSPAEAAALAVPSMGEAERLVVRAQAQSAAIIGRGGPLAWEHGFTLERIALAGPSDVDLTGAVVFIHRGTMTFTLAGVPVRLDAGDTMSVPDGVAIAAVRGDEAIAFAVRRA